MKEGEAEHTKIIILLLRKKEERWSSVTVSSRETTHYHLLPTVLFRFCILTARILLQMQGLRRTRGKSSANSMKNNDKPYAPFQQKPAGSQIDNLQLSVCILHLRKTKLEVVPAGIRSKRSARHSANSIPATRHSAKSIPNT